MRTIRTVALALSGGIDSAVAAYLLKARGLDVTGVFFRCWDSLEEKGYCTGEADAGDARRVAHQLGIGFKEVDFVKEYWNHVFMYMVESYKKGLTPNPDVLCNSAVKFGSFIDYASTRLGVDAIATGHYAQNSFGNFLEHSAEHFDARSPAKLLCANDKKKDQTLFLCKISQEALRRTMFPIGSLQKSEVRQLGKEIGLDWLAQKRSSRGICFVGKRDFMDFIDSFLDPVPGRFIHAESGKTVGEHSGVHHYTIGQRCCISGRHTALFVVHKNLETQDIIVADGTNHPLLYADSMTCADHHFISDDTSYNGTVRKNAASFSSKFRGKDGESFRNNSIEILQNAPSFSNQIPTTSRNCPWNDESWSGLFKFQHQMPLLQCTVNWGTNEFIPNPYDCQTAHSSSCSANPSQSLCGNVSTVKIAQPRRALTPGQFAVFYQGNEVVGSAVIKDIGPSMWHQDRSFSFQPETLGKEGVAALAVFS